MQLPDYSLEHAQGGIVCGIDEAGRGPWAGPVIAACVYWPDVNYIPAGLNDSKLLTRARRETLYEQIIDHARFGIGIGSCEDIEDHNILGATKLAMQRAYHAMDLVADVALVDGNQPPALPCRTEAVIQGDGLSLSVAAASIIAKVTRDRLMIRCADDYPLYGFERHVGYGTKEHVAALSTHGPTPIHRRSFAPIRRWYEAQANAA